MIPAHKEQSPSYEARIIARAKAARAACYGRPRIVNRAFEPAPIVTPEPVVDTSHITSPMAFIKAKCREHHISYDTFITTCRAQKMVEIRMAIICATHEQFPDLLISKLARLVKRHHTTVLYALGRSQNKKAQAAEINRRDAKAKVMYDKGVTLEDISKTLGISVNTVKAIRERRGWERRGRIKAKAKVTI